ncbi:acyl carrier protein [Streptomyces sp. JJ36]|uniref:acyl carrier protein n=1 Tax=Streptomyces sp. JJ36 TaxID=2736645 RepID=UPI001F35C4D7|nr:acyl carrier protein [Streptomyces sp. JJ36]MCF6524488.1 acyl carrier protein [Streptomyces sp. JJ36]
MAGAPLTEDALRTLVREHALRILELEPQELADATTFEDAGGDSLQRLELVSVLQDELGVQFSVDDEVRITSVKAAVEVAQQALAE